METYFAPPVRHTKEEIDEDIKIASTHPLIDEVMKASSGMFAVLNEQRQLVAINESFLKTMGIENAAEVMGLRLGEYVRCVHACEMPGGCGTSKYCSTCGSVVATLTSLDTDETAENTCTIKTERDYKELDLYFNVRSHPIKIEEHKFLLLFLQDISIHQQWAYLEQTFLHDISNIMQGLIGTSELLNDESKVTKTRLDTMGQLSRRLAQEVEIQKTLSTTLSHAYQPLYNKLTVHLIFDELSNIYNNHPLAIDRNLSFTYPEEDISFHSDHALVTRTLVNMVSNALEATTKNGWVTVKVETSGDTIIFCVWNPTVIPETVAIRMFQRNFSTKDGLGHGIGTFSMKLFGEKILGGQISFTSTDAEGTTFRFALQCI
ncbi:MAG: sensor histidine kinase [Desulfuromonadales bacterium]